MTDGLLEKAVKATGESDFAYCHYITPNDVGATGSHQCGFLVARSCRPLFFPTAGEKGSNMDRRVRIKWQDDFETDSRAVYYGVGTRNEYRLTRFGRGFEFLQPDYVGSLLVMTRRADEEFRAYILADQDDIEDFMATFNLDVTVGNQVIGKDRATCPDRIIADEFARFVEGHDTFPDTTEMADFARQCVSAAHQYSPQTIVQKADTVILRWVAAEYQLFSLMEEKLYRPVYTRPFANCHDLIDFANRILNRRKSRAGKSLEHHLAEIFTAAHLKFEAQAVTENNKRPDFLFPDGKSYHNLLFPAGKLTMLGAKTTCKDRWRQVLNEADRIPEKHLFTLQQGVSRNQLQEMRDEHLTLVVPKENMPLFLPEFHDCILCLSDFIGKVRERQQP